MKTREKIKDVAIRHFGQFGYEGASLSKIASEVGIQKPSLYAHYKSKLELFEYCMESSMEDFMEDVRLALDVDAPAQKKLHDVLSGFINSYNKPSGEHWLFYLRFTFIPPEELGEKWTKYPNDFIEKISEIVDEPIKVLAKELDAPASRKNEIKEAYLCMLDGLMVELMFGDDKSYTRRLKASWSMFIRGIK